MSNADLKPLSAAVAGALRRIVSEEFPRALEPLKRELRDSRSSLDQLVWRGTKDAVRNSSSKDQPDPQTILARGRDAVHRVLPAE